MAASSDALTSSTARTKRLLVMLPNGSLFGTTRTTMKHAGGILRRKRAPGVQLLHQANDLTVMSVSKHLAANTEHPAMRSAHHGGSIVHLYQSQVQIARPRFSACVHTGAQLGSAAHESEILARTGDTLKMLGATGHTAALNGILMGVETVDDNGKSLVVVVPNTLVSNPKAAKSLLPAGPLTTVEAGFIVDFCIPSNRAEDGYTHMLLNMIMVAQLLHQHSHVCWSWNTSIPLGGFHCRILKFARTRHTTSPP